MYMYLLCSYSASGPNVLEPWKDGLHNINCRCTYHFELTDTAYSVVVMVELHCGQTEIYTHVVEQIAHWMKSWVL